MPTPYSTPIEKLGRAVYLTACGLIFTFLMAPVLVIIPLSFNAEPYFTYPLAGFSMRWYEDFFDTMVWQLALKNSLIIGAAATVLATVLGTITALGLSGANFPLKPVVIALLISPMMVPIVIVGVGLYFFYARIGLVNSYLGMITAHTTLAIPFVVITVTATLAGFYATLARAGASLSERLLAPTLLGVALLLVISVLTLEPAAASAPPTATTAITVSPGTPSDAFQTPASAVSTSIATIRGLDSVRS